MILGALLRLTLPETDYFADSLMAFVKSDQVSAAQKFVVTAALHLRACEILSDEKLEQAKQSMMDLGDHYDAALPLLEQMRSTELRERPQG